MILFKFISYSTPDLKNTAIQKNSQKISPFFGLFLRGENL